MCCQVWQQLICAKLEGAMNSEHFDQVYTHYSYLIRINLQFWIEIK